MAPCSTVLSYLFSCTVVHVHALPTCPRAPVPYLWGFAQFFSLLSPAMSAGGLFSLLSILSLSSFSCMLQGCLVPEPNRYRNRPWLRPASCPACVWRRISVLFRVFTLRSLVRKLSLILVYTLLRDSCLRALTSQQHRLWVSLRSSVIGREIWLRTRVAVSL